MARQGEIREGEIPPFEDDAPRQDAPHIPEGSQQDRPAEGQGSQSPRFPWRWDCLVRKWRMCFLGRCLSCKMDSLASKGPFPWFWRVDGSPMSDSSCVHDGVFTGNACLVQGGAKGGKTEKTDDTRRNANESHASVANHKERSATERQR